MQNKKAIWSAIIIAALLIALIVFAVYKGKVEPVQNGHEEDGIRYVPPATRDLSDNEI